MGSFSAAVSPYAVGIAIAQTSPAAVIAKEASPTWLTPRSLPQMSRDQLSHAQDGTAYLLTDWQVRANDTGYDSYYRFASKVIDRSGLEQGGRISVGFDPRIEDVAVNFVHIIRDGKTIDRTAEVQFSVVEREKDLNDGIISGNLQVISNLKDIRVGDIIDYATTRHVRTKLWPHHYFSSFTDRFSEPLGYRAIRILWPSAQPLTFKATNSAISFAAKDAGDMREWEWVGAQRPFEQGEGDVPAWYPQYGRVDISTMKSWSEVAQWAVNLYAGDDSLPADFEKRLVEIAKRWPKAEDRVTEVTRYIQDNIRYVGEEMGEGSYVPRRPALVLERGYGDCKDKSLLLAVALRRVGIDAVPALVSTSPGFDLPDRLPSPGMFDHVIVRVMLGGQPLWIDPTATHRGGRGLGIVPSNLGYALPIRAGQAGLEEMKGFDRLAGTMDVTEQFAVDEKAPTALTLRVETRYSDSLADWMRSRVATRGMPNVARGNLEFYQKRFAGLTESKPLEVQDDRDANRVVMIENYALAKADFDKDKTLSDLNTNAYAVSDILPGRQAGLRKQPLSLPTAISRTHVIEVKAKDRAPWSPDDIDMQAGDIHFYRQSTQSGDTVRMVYKLSSGSQNMVPAEDAEAVYAISDKIAEESGLRFFLDKSPKPSKPSLAADMEALAPYRDDVQKAGTLMTKGDQASFVEALSILNQLSEKVERPSKGAGLVDGMKGVLLASLNRAAPAKAALLSSMEQYQGSPDMIRMLAGLQINALEYAPLFETLKVAVQYQPSVVATLDQDWVRYLSSHMRALPPTEREEKHDELCVLLASGQWRMQPRTLEGNGMLECAIKAHLKRNQPAEARALLAQHPSADTLAKLAVDKRYQALWPDLEPLSASGFRNSIEEEVKEAAEAAKQAPDDFGAATRYVRALRVAGKADQAVTAGKVLAGKKDRIEASGDPAFWFVNEYAYALAESGQVDQAIAQMDGLLALGVDTYPSLVSQVINRAEMLNHWGRSNLALTAFDEAETKYAQHASLYGKMWIWAGKACALREMKRDAEAKAWDDRLQEKPEENVSAVTMAAACRDDRIAIEAQLLSRMADPDKRDDVLGGFVRFEGSEKPSPFDLKLRRVMDTARSAPTVQEKLKEYGRSVTFAGTRAYWGEY
ncbi:hypothetical protein AI27_03155 [Sphingomonas sp. BHC-A]|nr:hypothetical protein AI27_03155 [Sphingomonas sp. BHC-A]